jgi:hypothetical protein
MLARDLVILYGLHEISLVAPSKHKTDPRAQDLLLMLHFTFWSPTMPPKAHCVLMEIVQKVTEMFEIAAKADSAVDLAWLYVESGTVRAILPKLKFWLGPGQTAANAGDLQELWYALLINYSRLY